MIEYLKNIKHKLQSQDISVMVGAGFSKNVSYKLFPDWRQLLMEMVEKMHGEQFRDEHAKLPFKNKPSLETFLEKKANQYILSEGVLKVASNFMQFNGYRESLDAYIERHTPWIEEREINKYLKYYAKQPEGNLILQEHLLTENDLITHKKLVTLPWNNIFTTNYDNLLETCVDQKVEQRIQQQIKDTKASLEKITSALKEEINKRKKIESKLLKARSELDNLLQKNRREAVVLISLEQRKTKVIKLEDELSESNYKIEGNEQGINKVEREIDKLKNQLKDCAIVVTHSAGLALKRKRNIIKLHGSLRLTENEKKRFGFDSDPRKQYVITEDDFNTYPTKHEAFTQLMRISLLRESFCLIGFSGQDPNFLAWIGWVRDIIVRKEQRDEEEIEGSKEKIYLVVPSIVLPEYDKAIFFENHRIVYVALMDPNCIKFLEDKTNKKVTDTGSIKEVFGLFFDFLQKDTELSGPEIGVEVSIQATFNSLSDELTGSQNQELTTNTNNLLLKFGELISVSAFNRIPSIHFIYDYNRYRFLRSSNQYFQIENGDVNAKELLKIIASLIKVQFYPHSILFEDSPTTFSSLYERAHNLSGDIFEEFVLIDLNDAIWQNDAKRFNKNIALLNESTFDHIRQEATYLNAIYQAIQLKFNEFKNILESWVASGHWLTKKAGLWSIVDPRQAMLSIVGNNQTLIQEHLYELELFSFIQKGLSNWGAATEDIELSNLKSKGLRLLSDNIDYLLNEINKKEIKIKPYGEGKFSVSRNVVLSNTNIYLQSLQFIGLLMESGFPISTGRITYRTFEKTYQVWAHCLNIYPFPTLFYVLQYSDENLLRRIGQDYAFSEFVAPVINPICADLHRAYLNSATPWAYRKSIPIFFSELMIALDSDIWEPFFIDLWRERIRSKVTFRERPNDRQKLFEKGLRLLQNSAFLEEIILDCLKEYESSPKEQHFTASSFLYEIDKNPALQTISTHKSEHLHESILILIHHLPENPYLIFPLGNLHKLLTPENIMDIRASLSKIDYKQIKNGRIWSPLLYWADNDKVVIQLIKDAILVSPLLWDSGFRKGSLLSHSDFIILHKLRKSNNDNGIEWTHAEAEQIFQKLLLELDKMTAFLTKGRESGYFTSQLEEMVYFLNDEAALLNHLPIFKITLERVTQMYYDQKEFNDPLEGIISDDHSKVVWGIEELFVSLLDNKSYLNYDLTLTAVFNKVLLKSQPGLDVCLYRVSHLVYDCINDSYLRRFTPHILQILIQYEKNYPLDCDLPFVDEQLIRMAFVLREWGEINGIIDHYINKLEDSRFNNIRYTLKFTLESIKKGLK